MKLSVDGLWHAESVYTSATESGVVPRHDEGRDQVSCSSMPGTKNVVIENTAFLFRRSREFSRCHGYELVT